MSDADGQAYLKEMLRISEADANALLAESYPCILSISRRTRGPIATPLWYEYREGKFRLGMDPASTKAKALVRAGRATLTVQRVVEPYQYVMAEGEARFLSEEELQARGETVWSVMRRIFDRYLDGDLPERYEQVLPVLSPTYRIVEITPQILRGENIPRHEDVIPKADDIPKLLAAAQEGKSLEEIMGFFGASDPSAS